MDSRIYYTKSKESVRQFGFISRDGVTIYYHVIDKDDSQYDRISTNSTEYLFAYNLDTLKDLCEQHTNGSPVTLKESTNLEVTGKRQIVEGAYLTYALISRDGDVLAYKHYIGDFAQYRPCYWGTVCAYNDRVKGVVSMGICLEEVTDRDLRDYNEQARLNLGVDPFVLYEY